LADKNFSKDKFLELRRQAEKLLSETGSISKIPLDADPLKMIHELQTFQIELEMQNDELRRSQQELLEAKIQYTHLYDFAPVGYLTINSEGSVLQANLTFADLLFMERNHLITQPLSVFVLKEDQDIYYNYRKKLSYPKTSNTCELRLKRGDETFLDVRLESNNTSDDIGDPDEHHIAVIDISSQKKAEKEKEEYRIRMQQAQKMEAIVALAGGIAHDFNNILYPIIGFTELTKLDLPKDDPLQDNLEEILMGSKRARDLVAQFLAFSSQRDDGTTAIDPKPIIEETLRFIRSTIPANIEIKKSLCRNPKCIMGNAIDLHEILMNLCTNTYHAMEESGGVLKVKLCKAEKSSQDPNIPSGEYCLLSVSDTGIGISPDIMNKIYEPYFTTKEIGKGSGLGLSVVHGIVKKYQGVITVQSDPGKRTVFNVYLPVAPDQKQDR